MGDRPRDHQSDAHPGDPPGLEEADPDGTSMGREILSDQRMRRGRASGFADTDADARHEDLGEIPRKAGREGHDAPEAEADREKARAIGAVGEAAERNAHRRIDDREGDAREQARSEEHTSELQSLMRISYAVFCLKKNKNN